MNKKTDAATIHEWRGIIHFLRWVTPVTLTLVLGLLSYSVNKVNDIDIKLAVIISQQLHRDDYALENRKFIAGLDKRVTRLERMTNNNR